MSKCVWIHLYNQACKFSAVDTYPFPVHWVTECKALILLAIFIQLN